MLLLLCSSSGSSSGTPSGMAVVLLVVVVTHEGGERCPCYRFQKRPGVLFFLLLLFLSRRGDQGKRWAQQHTPGPL